MKITLLLALILSPVLARADFVKIVSPSIAQTYTYSDATWHTLHWNPDARQLTANITFSTYQYVTHYDPLHEEDYQFVFPRVKYDQSNSTLYVTSTHGRRVDVAKISQGLIGQSVQPLPGTVIHIFKESGKVTVVLTASTIPPRYAWHLHWLEENEGFFLDNAVNAGIAALR